MRVVLSTAVALNEASTAMSYAPGDIVYVPGSDVEYIYAYANGASRAGQPAIYDPVTVSFKSKRAATNPAHLSAVVGIAPGTVTDTYYTLWQIKGAATGVYKEGAAVVAFQGFRISAAGTGSYFVVNNDTNTKLIASVGRKVGYVLSASAGKMTAKAGTKGASAGTAAIYLYGN